MLKKNLIHWFLAGLLITVCNVSYTQGIEFEQGSWEEIKILAKKANKPIFIDAYTEWCGPCKWMVNNIFTQEKVGAYFKENFIAYKMDMEKGEGLEFAKLYKVKVYPTWLFFSEEGALMHKAVGTRNADDLIKLCETALDPERQLVAFVKKYNDGVRDKGFLKDYLKMLTQCGEPITKEFDEYWEMLTDEEKQTADGLTIIANASEHFRSFKHPLTTYLISNRAAYENATNEFEVMDYISNCYNKSIWDIAKIKDTKEQKLLIKELLVVFPNHKKDINKYLTYIEITLQEKPNKTQKSKAYANYLKVCQNANELNGVAWDTYERSNDPQELKEALGLVNRSIAINKGYNNVDTKAALLFKLKDYKEAKKTAEEAIKIAEKLGINPNVTIELLEDINAKLAVN